MNETKPTYYIASLQRRGFLFHPAYEPDLHMTDVNGKKVKVRVTGRKPQGIFDALKEIETTVNARAKIATFAPRYQPGFLAFEEMRKLQIEQRGIRFEIVAPT